MRRLLIVLVILLISALAGASESIAQTKRTFGWVEKVRLMPDGVVVHAKLDTGADSSSLHAQNIAKFKEGDTEWVKFEIVNRYGERMTIKKEIHRIAMVKRHKGKTQYRKVVRMGICLGNLYQLTDVNLVDRRNFAYQLLVGRDFLAGSAIIDPAISYSAEPDCEEKPKE